MSPDEARGEIERRQAAGDRMIDALRASLPPDEQAEFDATRAHCRDTGTWPHKRIGPKSIVRYRPLRCAPREHVVRFIVLDDGPLPEVHAEVATADPAALRQRLTELLATLIEAPALVEALTTGAGATR